MKPGTVEWIDKAEQDFKVAGGLIRRKDPVYDSVCFHRQQCAEKYLKLRLHEASLVIPRTHDCVGLLQLLLPVEPLLAALAPELRRLNDYAVKSRYPGYSSTKPDAQQALKDMRVVRKEIRSSLGLR